MYCRKNSSGQWIIGNGNQPPVILSSAHCKSQFEAKKIAQTIDGFNIPLSEPTPGKGKIWFCMRFFLWISLALSSMLNIYYFFRYGFPSGIWWLVPHESILIDILLITVVGVVSTAIHEFGHMVFGRSWTVSAQILHRVISTNLNHVWAWPRIRRIEAISAGLIFDSVLLSALFAVQIIFDNAYAASAASTVCLRMVWQLGFHAIRDGRLLIVLTLDRPLFFSKPSNNGEYLLSFIFRLFGYAMDLFIIWQWPIALTIGLLEV